MAVQPYPNHFYTYEGFGPTTLDLLERLPSLHQFPHDSSEVLDHLKMVIQHAPELTRTYISQISCYLRRNMETNLNIIPSMDCLVSLHGILPLSFKSSLSSLLQDKYPWMSFKEEVNKLKAINRSLIEPYFWLLSRIALWHQLQTEDFFYQASQSFEVFFLLEYLHVIVTFEFETGSYLNQIESFQPFLSIYNLFIDHPQIFHTHAPLEQLKKLSVSIFCFLSNFQLEDLQRVKIVFIAAGQLLTFLEQCTISLEEEVMKVLMPLIRKCGNQRERKDQLIGAIFDGVRGLLVADWTLDKEFQWSWRIKIIWDLLGISSIEQADLIKELTSTSREIIKQLSFC